MLFPASEVCFCSSTAFMRSEIKKKMSSPVNDAKSQKAFSILSSKKLSVVNFFVYVLGSFGFQLCAFQQV